MFTKLLSKLLSGLLFAILFVPVTHACTAFVVYRNGLALAGNNEDFWLTDTKIWYVPKEGSNRGVAGKLGRVYFGFNNFYPQGGMNEAGLFFDGFATAEYKVKDSTGKPRFEGNISDYVMANCETVAEVVAIFEKHDLSWLANAMLMFGDQYGDSVIIEGDEFIRIKGDHQVVTNFYQSLTPPDKYTCSRYQAAIRMLGKGEPVSVETCRNVLSATRQNGAAPTQYSNVYDLKQQLIYLYHFHNFDEVVCLDLKKELEQGAHEIDLPSLFSEKRDFAEFQAKRKQEILDQTEARRAKDIAPATFQEFAGIFEFDVGLANKPKAKFFVEDEQFFVVADTNNEKEQLYPEAQDLFFRIGDMGPQTFKFRRNSDREITSVTISVMGRTYRGVRLE